MSDPSSLQVTAAPPPREAAIPSDSAPAGAIHEPQPEPAPPKALGSLAVTKALLSSLLLGAAAALLFIVWRHQCAQILGWGGDALGAAVIALASGLIAGVLAIRRWWRDHLDPRFAVVVSTLALSALCVLTQWLAPVLGKLASGLAASRLSMVPDALVCWLFASLLLLPPSTLLGAIGSLLHRQTTWSVRTMHPGIPQQTPKPGGYRLSFTSFLSPPSLIAVIAFLTTLNFALPRALPALGSSGATAAALAALAGLTLLHAHPRLPGQPPVPFLVVLASLVIFCLPNPGNGEKHRQWSYGRPVPLTQPPAVLYAAEGSRTDIRVTQDQTDVTLLLNGVPVSGLGTNVAPELAMAYIPRFLHPEAKRVLVAGYGSGAAAGASLLFPGTSVLCSEPESAMFTMAKGFSSANHLAVKTSSSLSLGEPDTRALMRSHPASFDLILVNYLDTRLPNVRDFLTAQALRDARVALAPKGILALRLCVPSFTPADAALAVRTVLAAFPHAVWVRLTARDSLLLASSQPIEPAPASVATAQNFVQTQPAIQSDLRQILNTSSVASLFFQTLWLDETGLRQLGAYQSSDSVATDWSPKYNQGGLTARAAVDQPPGLLDQEIATASSHGWFEINFARCGLGPADAALFHKIALRLKENGQINTALKLVRWGLQIAPEEPYLLADEAILSGENDPKLFESIGSRVAKGSVDAANRLGVNLWASGQYDLAVVVFQKIVEVCPTSATAWHNLASNYRHGGHADLAAPLLAKAAALDPANDATSQLPVDGFAPPPSPNSPSSTGRSKPNE